MCQQGPEQFRLSLGDIETQPELRFARLVKQVNQKINADTIVAESMANIDAEYEALVAEFASVSV